MDLTNHLNNMSEKFNEVLEFSDWKQIDEFYFEYKRSPNNLIGEHKCESWFSVEPVLLTYEENDNYVTKIWFKIKDRGFSDKSLEELFKFMKPFKDEDYVGYNYFINPGYPNGYWYNHVL